MQKSHLAIAITSVIGMGSATLPGTAMSATLANGFYDMVINTTPFVAGAGFNYGSDGAWNSGISENDLPGGISGLSWPMEDDTVATPVKGRYAGNPNDGVQGTVALRIEDGVITGTGGFEFDTISFTTAGNRVEYGGSSGFTGSIDAAGNISLTPTGALGAWEFTTGLVDKRWNVDDFNGTSVPNNNTAYDVFSTGSATNTEGTINGAAFDGTTAILVKGGAYGSDWGGFFSIPYFEVWNVSFTNTGDLPGEVPIPGAVWLFGSGLLGLISIARRKRIV